MEGIAFKERIQDHLREGWYQWEQLLPDPPKEFDDYYWLFDSQSGWVDPLDLAPGRDETLTDIFDECLMSHSFIEGTSSYLIDRGGFRRALPRMTCDEQSLLIGFQCRKEDVGKALAKANDQNYCAIELPFSAIELWYRDGWWECFPTHHPLMAHVGTELQSAKVDTEMWETQRSDDATSVYPEFPSNS